MEKKHITDTNTGNYKIIESQFRVALFFGHNMLVLVDQSGKFISEINGLATSKNGTIKPVGYLKSDRLQVYEFQNPHLYNAKQPQKILYEDVQQNIMDRWNTARDAKDAINALNLSYPIFGAGRNSNSVTSTLIMSMGLNEPNISGSKWTPGKGRIILSDLTLQTIKKKII